jgi:hypothetical protein
MPCPSAPRSHRFRCLRVCAIKIIDYDYIVHYFTIWCTSLEVEREKRAGISRAGRMVSFIVFVNMNKYF